MVKSVIASELDRYSVAFRNFINKHELPKEWFLKPDHFAVKCANKQDYRETCAMFAEDVNDDGIWQLSLDGRLLASAKLAKNTELGGYEFDWVEIMQPRPGKENVSGFVEHTEFLFTDFTTVEGFLTEKGIDYELQENPGHKWVNIVIDDDGREIKVNNKLLADVVEWEREQGLLHKIGVEA